MPYITLSVISCTIALYYIISYLTLSVFPLSHIHSFIFLDLDITSLSLSPYQCVINLTKQNTHTRKHETYSLPSATHMNKQNKHTYTHTHARTHLLYIHMLYYMHTIHVRGDDKSNSRQSGEKCPVLVRVYMNVCMKYVQYERIKATLYGCTWCAEMYAPMYVCLYVCMHVCMHIPCVPLKIWSASAFSLENSSYLPTHQPSRTGCYMRECINV